MSSPRVLLALLALAGCGDLPRPFQGYSGRTALRLSQPPPARLAVVPATGALLPAAAGNAFAADVVDALVAQEVPAVAADPHRGDWSLVVAAELHQGQVTPAFTVVDPKGVEKGTAEGHPVPAVLWAAAAPATLQQAAVSAAPGISSLLTKIEAEREQSDPNSLLNRPAKVAVRDVRGAPGDGDSALTREMRRELPKLGETVFDGPNPDFTVAGEVRAVPLGEGQIRVEVQWVVTDIRGTERGRIVQLNEVPGDAVSGIWGEVAQVVAREAAGGVRDVVLQQSGIRKPVS